MECWNFVKLFCGNFRNQIIAIVTPIILLPLLITPGTPESRCLFVVMLMAIYWLFEVMPLAVTAMIPVFLYPMTGVMSSASVCSKYLPDVNFLSFGGLVVALAVEKCNLHRRLALRVLAMVGSDPKWILFGFMCITAFLSMWMSNTACTAMMVPIALSVIEEWKKGDQKDENDSTELVLKSHKTESFLSERTSSTEVKMPAVPPSQQELTKEQMGVAKSLLLCIAYASSIGGTATLTGSPTNISMVGLMKSLFPMDAGRSVTYVIFLAFALPTTVVTLVLSWIALQCYFLGLKKTFISFYPKCLKKSSDETTTGSSSTSSGKKDKVSKMFIEHYRSLPKMSYAESSVLGVFILLVILWILRDLGAPGFSGFGVLFKKGYFTDATSAMLIMVLLFVLPSEKPCDTLKQEKRNGKKKKTSTLMDWDTMKKRFPWDVVFLLGGGFALAAGVRESGLSASIGNILGRLYTLPLGPLQLICVIIAIIITNIASNVVTASILIPIVSGMAQKLEISPLAVILPVTLGCSYAYMLPVGTPPNAIIFGPGLLQLKDMMGAGFFLSIISAVVVVVHCQTFARLYIPLDGYPDWANATAIAIMQANGTLIS